MKKILLPFILGLACLFSSNSAYAVLQDGSAATDWTLTDLNGQTHHLFDLLDQGKTVYIDFSATWCGPCWNFHNSGSLENLYTNYGPGGTNEVDVFFIEADVSTNLACLYGPTGCVGGTQGNWVAGTPYPIINLDASTSWVASSYGITYYPTIYAICPQTRKVYESGQKGTSGQYNYVSSCALNYLVDQVVDAKCNGKKDGSINISTQAGAAPFQYKWSNGATTQDVYGLGSGTYKVTVTDVNGISVVSDNIIIDEPSAVEIDATLVDEGCVGNSGGSIQLDANGGTPGYTYAWSNGASGPGISGLKAGNYSVVVTDNNACKTNKTYTLTADEIPYSYAGEDATLNCIHPQLEIEGDGETGGSIDYEWTTPDGNIVSGANTLMPIVNKTGTYTLHVTNSSTGCSSLDATKITANFTPTTADAGADGNINCTSPQILLDGSKSSTGANIQFDWVTSDGNIVSGGKTNKAIVSLGGTYTLIVTNKLSGCTSEDATVVEQNTDAPNSVIAAPGIINCGVAEITLDGSASSKGANITYHWFTDGGNILSGVDSSNAKVNAAGNYFLVVHNNLSLCNDTTNVLVLQDANVPKAASGKGGELNCKVQTIQLDGSASSTGANYNVSWTTTNGHIVSGANTYTPTVDAAGTYTIHITNTDNNCVAVSSVVITEDQLSKVPVSIYNASTNLLDVNFVDASTGKPTTYLWEFGDGNTSSDQNPVHSYSVGGTFTVCLTVTNDCGTNKTCQELTVSNNTAIPSISNVGILNATCKGGSNGCIDITVINGTAPYTYAWSNGVTTEDPCNIPAGNYTVTVTDANGISVVSNNISVTELYYVNITNTFNEQPDCNGNNGSIALNVNSNGGQLTYKWSQDPELNSAVAENLPEGNYTVIITDQYGCTAENQIELLDKGQRIDANVTEAKCNDAANGAIDLNVSGGTAPYSYLWVNGATTQDLANVSKGSYSCQVTDASGCVKNINLDVTAPDPITAQVDLTKPQKGKDNGSISIVPAGGTQPYTYLWNNGASDQKIQNLAPGQYSVSITDANGCLKIETIQLDEAVGTFSFDVLSYVNVFPNPNNGMFKIEATFTKPTSVQINVLDILGRKILDEKFEGTEMFKNINLSDSPAGTYFLYMYSDNKFYTEKINIIK